MHVDLSMQEIRLILRSFNEHAQADIDEQLLARRLEQYLPQSLEMRMRNYNIDAQTLPPLPDDPA